MNLDITCGITLYEIKTEPSVMSGIWEKEDQDRTRTDDLEVTFRIL
jgi:hypothetical protein